VIDKKQMQIAGLGVAALLAWLFFFREGDTSISIDDLSDEELTYDPYDQTNPGIYDGNMPGFTSNINVNVDPSMFGSLSRQYIPLFGMIGVVATGIAPPPPPPKPIARRERESGLVSFSSRTRGGSGRRGATIGNSGSPGGSRT
jgi:hypothetical protein